MTISSLTSYVFDLQTIRMKDIYGMWGHPVRWTVNSVFFLRSRYYGPSKQHQINPTKAIEIEMQQMQMWAAHDIVHGLQFWKWMKMGSRNLGEYIWHVSIKRIEFRVFPFELYPTPQNLTVVDGGSKLCTSFGPNGKGQGIHIQIIHHLAEIVEWKSLWNTPSL